MSAKFKVIMLSIMNMTSLLSLVLAILLIHGLEALDQLLIYWLEGIDQSIIMKLLCIILPHLLILFAILALTPLTIVPVIISAITATIFCIQAKLKKDKKYWHYAIFILVSLAQGYVFYYYYVNILRPMFGGSS